MVLKPAVPPASTPPLFSVTGVVAQIRQALFALPDHRTGGNHQKYVIGDAALSAFSACFMQSPSFLDDQRRMQKERGRNNAGSLFGVHQIPSTQQIANLLDPIAPAHLDAGFMTLAEAMHPHGVLKTPRQTDGRRLIALDGTEYHSSCAISCPPCSTRTLSYDKRQFYHMAVTPVLVAQGQADVFPLPPAFVRLQDGHLKQDGEIRAAARWLHHWGKHIASWRTTLLGDALYGHQPVCKQVLAQGCAFLGSPADCSESSRRSHGQGFIIMMNKIPNSSDMIFDLFRKRERFSNQA